MTDLSEFVSLHNATLTTDTRRVAKHFKRVHKNVLQAYDRLACSAEFNRLNFQPVDEVDEKGEPRRVIHMTKDGFMFLVMGFTGKEAARIKEAYIAAFNSMAAQLQAISLSGFHGLWDRRLDLEKRDQVSFMWASFGARKMNDRKREKPHIADERRRLDAEIQPGLPGLTPAPTLQLVGRSRRASNDARARKKA